MEMRGGQKEEMRGRDWRLTDKAKGRKNEETSQEEIKVAEVENVGRK